VVSGGEVEAACLGCSSLDRLIMRADSVDTALFRGDFVEPSERLLLFFPFF
jgi:hypothetical protein